MHQGDWDSMIEIYIKKDRAYMITHLHHCKWVAKWPLAKPNLESWLLNWNKLKKKEIGDAYVLDNHPYVFVTQGAHAGYPTPGFTLHGLDIPGIISRNDFLTNTDERQIGRLCILPEDFDEEKVRQNLRRSNIQNINANNVRFGRWKEPELIENQPWLKYKGKWGEDTKYLGWDGPQNPPVSRSPNKQSLKEAIQGGYKSGSVLMNWPGVR